MNKIETKIIDSLSKAIISSAYSLGNTTRESIKNAIKNEKNNIAIDILSDITKNYKIAENGEYPLCQDTGIVVLFIEIGKNFNINFDIEGTLNKAVAKAYNEGYLRKSVVKDPLNRENTKNNTPAVIYYEFKDGNEFKINYMLKGAGSENVAKLKMFNPTASKEEISDFVVETVKDAGPNPCPPTVVGVGIGGTFEKAALLSKKSLLREIGNRNKNVFYADMETNILNKINNLNIGPMGYGGKTTSFDVFIESYPCHIASLPVAVNINCHSIRHGSIIIK